MNNTAVVVEELVPVVEALRAAGINVYVSPDRHGRASAWVVIERDGNAGTVQYDRLDGYGVHFAIKPNRDTGSSLLVEFPGEPDRTGYLTSRRSVTVEQVVDAARKATGATFSNFATAGKRLPNDGLQHFSWAKLVPVGE